MTAFRRIDLRDVNQAQKGQHKMRVFGVDVSHWEGKINWQAAVSAVGFAYFKCTDGTRAVDAQYENNARGCTQAGIPHAPYHFYQPALDPVAQAEHFIHTAGRQYKRYIVDVEGPEREPRLAQKLLAFLERVEKLTASQPAIYTSAGYWNEHVFPHPRWASQYDLIVAHYTTQHSPLLPIGWNSYVIWQFSDFWSFTGCAEDADADWFNGDIEQCRTWFGNYRPPETPVERGFELHSLFDNLRIRQSPSLDARVTGHLLRDEVVELEQLAGNDVWARHTRGWSCVEKDGYRYMEIKK